MKLINSELPPIIFLLGPTASGKTACAMRLVEQFPNTLELISVDSAMVYRRMTIGTGKPSSEELRRAPHRLIDIREPWETYSAADFCRDASLAIAEVHNQDRIPLLVGGTFLYFKALQYGLSDLPTANPAVRASIVAQAEQQGWPALHEQLQRVDPIAATRIKPNDSQRIIRALEVYQLTGKSLSDWHKVPIVNSGGTIQPTHTFILCPDDRRILHANIEARFRTMMTQGLLAEVEALLTEKNITSALPSMKSVGYRQLAEYLMSQDSEHPSSLDTAIEQGIAATRQLAKRQLTWLRGLTSDSILRFQSGDALLKNCKFLLKNV